MGRHPTNCFERNNSQQSRADEGTDPGEEEEEPHDGALHGLGSCRIGKLQTCENNKSMVMVILLADMPVEVCKGYRQPINIFLIFKVTSSDAFVLPQIIQYKGYTRSSAETR